jgi:hypothetical protein
MDLSGPSIDVKLKERKKRKIQYVDGTITICIELALGLF